MIKELMQIARSEIKPFHDDPYLKAFILLCPFSTFIETGTFRGDSVVWVAQAKPSVNCLTIERNSWYHRYAKNSYSHVKNVEFIKGDSRVVLEEEIPKCNSPIMFWLDAHWEKDWPLLDELRIILRSGKPSIVIIDDFKVTKHPSLGYDYYQGTDLGIEYIQRISRKLNLFVPNYDSADHWRGYAVMFVNMEPIFSSRLEPID